MFSDTGISFHSGTLVLPIKEKPRFCTTEVVLFVGQALLSKAIATRSASTITAMRTATALLQTARANQKLSFTPMTVTKTQMQVNVAGRAVKRTTKPMSLPTFDFGWIVPFRANRTLKITIMVIAVVLDIVPP